MARTATGGLNDGLEPTAETLGLRCARTQHENRRVCIDSLAAEQQEKQSLVPAAAKLVVLSSISIMGNL
jgi:hypothetical protein